jgi:DNA invertase Pin-like site-specific DNA recombinase
MDAMFGMFAEMGRDLIRERTRAGLVPHALLAGLEGESRSSMKNRCERSKH